MFPFTIFGPVPNRSLSFLHHFFTAVTQWFDADYVPEGAAQVRAQEDRVDWIRCIPFIILHLGCIGVIWVGAPLKCVLAAIGLYFIRMFAVTGIYHRYFSHKTYKTSRAGQFFLALWGATTVQRGPLWWAYHHRHHHRHSDEAEDAHSPHVHGFWWSHIGWITSRRNFPTDYSQVKDLAKYPELVFLNRFDAVVPLLFAVTLWAIGGWPLLIWGFFISTTALFHGTSCINSLAHLMGRRRYKTEDDSRNSFILTLITLGEGWHNNHHRYQAAARNGFYWWEFDPTYYGLRVLSWTRLIQDLKPVPASVLEEGAHFEHRESVVAARRAVERMGEHSKFRKVMPTAAALAVASVHVSPTAKAVMPPPSATASTPLPRP
ncbi:MAG TPA: fatty acid desaturase [Opitutaceae bacterium]|jgi:stearoyl-CoA desaturase (delta-9 desaturase)